MRRLDFDARNNSSCMSGTLRKHDALFRQLLSCNTLQQCITHQSPIISKLRKGWALHITA